MKSLSNTIIIVLILAVGLLAGILIGKKSQAPNQQDQLAVLEEPQDLGQEDFSDYVDEQPGPVHEYETSPRETKNPICVGEFCDGSGAGDGVERTVLQVPIIVNDGGPIGCGVSVRFMPHAVPQTVAVLNATYAKLFALEATSGVQGDPYHNYIADQHQLRFDRAEILNGTASVYLLGSIMGMHCGDPAFRAQIEQAAFQFDTVDSLVVYLNGQVYDWCQLDQSSGEGPCGDGPQYWVAEK